MGAVVTRMKRPFQNYNIESRAHKIISQEKPLPAPKYEVDQMHIDHIIKENPDEFQMTLKKNEELDKNLKNIFVISNTAIPDQSMGNPKRPLPFERSSFKEPTFGIVEPEKVGRGKVTLVNALKFITNHHADTSSYSAAFIAKEYLLPEVTVKNVLRYCKTFEVYIPEIKNTKVKFAGPSLQRIKVVTKPLKRIHSGREKDKEDSSGQV